MMMMMMMMMRMVMRMVVEVVVVVVVVVLYVALTVVYYLCRQRGVLCMSQGELLANFRLNYSCFSG
jgi:hypothetical protein